MEHSIDVENHVSVVLRALTVTVIQPTRNLSMALESTKKFAGVLGAGGASQQPRCSPHLSSWQRASLAQAWPWAAWQRSKRQPHWHPCHQRRPFCRLRNIVKGEVLDVNKSSINNFGKAVLIGLTPLLCFCGSLGWHLVEMVSAELAVSCACVVWADRLTA